MNKAELSAVVAEQIGLSKKDADAAVKVVFDTIAAEFQKKERFR